MSVASPDSPTDREVEPAADVLGGVMAGDGAGRPPRPPWLTLRRLPGMVAEAIRLVWAAARRELAFMVVLQAIAGVGVVVVILLGKDLLEAIVAADRGERPSASVLGTKVVLLIIATTVITSAQALVRARRDVLTELVTQHASRRILDVTCAVELEAFDRPKFHDSLQRAVMSGRTRPLQLVEGLIMLVGSSLGVVGVAVALFTIVPLLAPVALLAAVPLWIAAMNRGQEYYDFVCRTTPAERERNYLVGLLTGRDPAKEVRAFGLAGHLRRRWERRTNDRLADLRRTVHRQLRQSVGGGLASSVVIGGALIGLLWLLWTDRLSLVQVGAAAGAILLLGQRLIEAADGTDLLFEAAPLMNDMGEFLAMEPAVRASRPTAPAPAGFSRLRVDDVTFTYPGSTRPALEGVDMEVEAGEVVALVGENGSGKTTLAKLLSRLYVPSAGRILWDDVDTATVDPDQLRQGVAVLFQDFVRYLLPATDNVGVGNYERSDDHAAVVAAATSAGADEFLAKLPDGYDTVLGPEFEGGKDLSIGQWQRVALARAYFRDAPFLILDEPTAALDPRAEYELFASIRTMFRGRTVLLISHRFSSVRSADRVYVLSEGRVIEQGDHDELMALDGLYAELFTMQAASYRDSTGDTL